MAIEYVPTGVVLEVEIVKVELQLGEQLGEEKLAVAPFGRPEAEKDTDWLFPDTRPILTVVETEPQGEVEPDEGLIDREKSKGAALTVIVVVAEQVTPCLVVSNLAV